MGKTINVSPEINLQDTVDITSKTILDETIRFKKELLKYERQDIKVCIYAAEKEEKVLRLSVRIVLDF